MNAVMRTLCAIAVLSSVLGTASGCGVIADKDRIRIARINDRYITRGELFKVIREMPDDERPSIRNRGDLLRVLNTYVDDQLRQPLAAQVESELQSQGKELVPREAAKQRYLQQYQEEDYATIYEAKDGKALGMSDIQLEAMKQEMDLGIDRVLEKMRGEAAVAYRAMQAVKSGELTLTDSDFEQEYKLRKNDLKSLEWLKFRAIRFMADVPGSETEAANVCRRIAAGEAFDALYKEYATRNPVYVIESEIENNPELVRFRSFWLSASGIEKGGVIGPVYLPEYQVMVESGGQRGIKNMPAAYLVLEALDYRPERPLTLQEAKPALAPPILMTRMMQTLREQNGVEVYENKLPDPSLFGDKLGKTTVMM